MQKKTIIYVYIKKIKLTSQEIDDFINKFNFNMYQNLGNNIDPKLIKDKLQKLKKPKLQEILKLINEEYDKMKKKK